VIFPDSFDTGSDRFGGIVTMQKLIGSLLSFSFFMLVALVASCQRQTSTNPTPTFQPTPVMMVTRVVLESGEPSPTPALCTTLPEGMTLIVEPVSSESAKVQLNGLKPGESLTLLFVAQSTLTDRHEVEISLTNVVEPDGSLTYFINGLSALSDATENIWTVQVIHARGIACQEFSLP